jgi:hypothetical protein
MATITSAPPTSCAPKRRFPAEVARSSVSGGPRGSRRQVPANKGYWIGTCLRWALHHRIAFGFGPLANPPREPFAHRKAILRERGAILAKSRLNAAAIVTAPPTTGMLPASLCSGTSALVLVRVFAQRTSTPLASEPVRSICGCADRAGITYCGAGLMAGRPAASDVDLPDFSKLHADGRDPLLAFTRPP